MTNQNQEPELSHPDGPQKVNVKKPTCGIIMPISEIDGLPEQHWKEVLAILVDVATDAGFDTKLVSDAEDVGIIQKRIVQNIYNNDIVICDISAVNPNVMFELGMRLTFDKSAVIVKDESTRSPFDVGPLEYVHYPRDLRFNKIVDFKKRLKSKLIATYESSKKPNYSMYLKGFGEFVVAEVDTKEVSKEDFVMNEMREMKDMLFTLGRRIDKSNSYNPVLSSEERKLLKKAQIDSYFNALKKAYIRNNNLEDLDDKVEYEKFMLFVSQSKMFNQYFSDPEEMVAYITGTNPFI